MALNFCFRICTKAIIFIGIILLFSCEDSSFSINYCTNCVSEEPETGTLEINLKKAFSTNSVIIRIYEGNLEDSLLLATWITKEAGTTRDVPLNKTYTLTASYYVNESAYIAVNSVIPRVRYDETSCEEPCFYVYDNTVNLRLKYTK
jgi:hypothetical protein